MATKAKGKPKKPGAVRIPSDDFEMEIDGVIYAPHADEWVEVRPGMAVSSIRVQSAMARLQEEMQAVKGDDGAESQILRQLDEQFTMACDSVAKRVVAWNWTDMEGVPLPSPRNAPDVIADLSAEEVSYLLTLGMSTGSDRGNASQP